jgi:hypothetical protein
MILQSNRFDQYHWNHEPSSLYRNTIAGLPPGERIFIFFEKIRFASQKQNFSNFSFLAKQIGKNGLK